MGLKRGVMLGRIPQVTLLVDALAGEDKQINLQGFKLRRQGRVNVTAILTLQRAAGTDQRDPLAPGDFVADRQAVGKYGEIPVGELARQVKAGRTGIKGDSHPFADPRQRVACNIGFVGVMAFQARAKRLAAVATGRMEQPRPSVLTQDPPLLLKPVQIAADRLFADGKLFCQRLGRQPVAAAQQGNNVLLSVLFHASVPGKINRFLPDYPGL